MSAKDDAISALAVVSSFINSVPDAPSVPDDTECQHKISKATSLVNELLTVLNPPVENNAPSASAPTVTEGAPTAPTGDAPTASSGDSTDGSDPSTPMN